MKIPPIDRLNLLASTARAGPQGFTGHIKLAASTTAVHPNDSTMRPCVSWPGQVGSCKPGSRITARGEARGSNSFVAELVTLGHNLGRFTYGVMTREHSPAGLLRQPVKASSVEDALLRYPHVEKMAKVAQDNYMGVPETGRVSRRPVGASSPFINELIKFHQLSLGPRLHA